MAKQALQDVELRYARDIRRAVQDLREVRESLFEAQRALCEWNAAKGLPVFDAYHEVRSAINYLLQYHKETWPIE